LLQQAKMRSEPFLDLLRVTFTIGQALPLIVEKGPGYIVGVLSGRAVFAEGSKAWN
jgi:hypothetical protein